MVNVFPTHIGTKVFAKAAKLFLVCPQRMDGSVSFSAQRIQKLPHAFLNLRTDTAYRLLLHDLISAGLFLPRG
jgi:hypothetical protein